MKLIITVQFLCGHYHGRNREKILEDFPPSPMRLFQALLAASPRGLYGKQNVAIRDNALQWLGNLAPPTIVANETIKSGEDTINYVPNNDNKFDHIRTDKSMHHHVLLDDGKVKYVWGFDVDETTREFAKAICAMSQLITYLGQTTDLVIAHGEVTEDFTEDESKAIFKPETSKGDWQIPTKGSLQACQERYKERKNLVDFPTPARWVDYRNKNAIYLDAPTALFELRQNGGKNRLPFEPVLLQQVSAMTRHAWLNFLRENKNFADDYGADLLAQKFAGHESNTSEKSVDAPHVAFVPLPSLNKEFTADGKIRRVLVIGYGCESKENRQMFEDIANKLNGALLIDEKTGEKKGEIIKVEPKEYKMVYCFIAKNHQFAKVWRTVTPIILSGHPRLITNNENPNAEQTKIFKKGRSPEDFILKCLKEAGIPLEIVESVDATKSPVVPKTQHSFLYKPNERLRSSPRFHAEVVFKKPIVGSLVIGRGRFAGFGLMMPIE
ncbi:type I-U CRISPR-associated protein Csb2 [soil metagenome]